MGGLKDALSFGLSQLSARLGRRAVGPQQLPSGERVDELVARYRRLREVSLRVNHRLVKCLPDDALSFAASRLGMGRGRTFVFRNEYESSTLFDYAITHHRVSGLNVVERMLRDSRPRAGSDEELLLEARRKAHYSLLLVTGAIRGFCVEVADILTNETFRLADINLSNTALEGVVLATRTLPLGEFSMTSGTALPADNETLLQEVRKYVKGTLHGADVRQLDPEDAARFEAFAIRLCRTLPMRGRLVHVEPGASAEDIIASVPDRDSDSEMVEAGRWSRKMKIGRNEPCLCGSGEKYKRCCGHGMQ